MPALQTLYPAADFISATVCSYRHADMLQPACYHMAVAPALVTLGDNVVEVEGHWVWLAPSLGQGAELSVTCGWQRVHNHEG